MHNLILITYSQCGRTVQKQQPVKWANIGFKPEIFKNEIYRFYLLITQCFIDDSYDILLLEYYERIFQNK